MKTMNGRAARVVPRDDQQVVANASWAGSRLLMGEVWLVIELQGWRQ